MSERVLKVGIIGLGHLHPRSYMPLFESVPTTAVTAVAEADDELREPFCRDFDVKGYPSVEALLGAEKIDIAAVFMPHADCPSAAVDVAGKGVHLMVEKPMAASAEGASRIVRAAEAAGVKLTTGYCWRFHPAAVEFRRLVQSGVLGRVIGAEGRCAAGRLERYIEGNSAWMLDRKRSGGGPMLNLGVHWIDLFRWMLDEEVVEVSGRNVKVDTRDARIRYDVEDNSFAHLRFSGGAIAALDISYSVPDAFPHGRDLYLSVRGTKGVVSWAPAYEGEKDVLFVTSDAPEFSGSRQRRYEYALAPAPGYSGWMGREYVRTFADSVLAGTAPPIAGEDGLAALDVVEAFYRSAAEKRWVEVERTRIANIHRGDTETRRTE